MSDDEEIDPEMAREFLGDLADMSPEERRRNAEVFEKMAAIAEQHHEEHPERAAPPTDEEILGGLDFPISSATVRVEEVGTNRQVDRPDEAIEGLNLIGQAFEGAGGVIRIEGPIHFEPPGSDELLEGDLYLPPDPNEHLSD